MSGPVSTPRVSARTGHTLRHSNTSPLVMLNASFAAWGDCAAQTITSATRSASAASQTNDGPPGSALGIGTIQSVCQQRDMVISRAGHKQHSHHRADAPENLGQNQNPQQTSQNQVW